MARQHIPAQTVVTCDRCDEPIDSAAREGLTLKGDRVVRDLLGSGAGGPVEYDLCAGCARDFDAFMSDGGV